MELLSRHSALPAAVVEPDGNFQGILNRAYNRMVLYAHM